MAGESVLRIKEKEREASELVDNAKLDAKKIVQKAYEEKSVYIEEKNMLLKEEEAKIRDKYQKETEKIIRDLQNEEEQKIKKITQACEKNISNVVAYISCEIVKE